MFNVDIGSAVVKFFAEWKKAKRAHQWGRLLFSMAFSGTVSFYGVAGAARIAGQPEVIADGAGMVSVAVFLLSLFVRSDLTKGMTISIPSEIAGKMHKEGQTTIHRE